MSVFFCLCAYVYLEVCVQLCIEHAGNSCHFVLCACIYFVGAKIVHIPPWCMWRQAKSACTMTNIQVHMNANPPCIEAFLNLTSFLDMCHKRTECAVADDMTNEVFLRPALIFVNVQQNSFKTRGEVAQWLFVWYTLNDNFQFVIIK